MTVDSQWAGSVDMDESLISPSVDLSDYRNTTLQFTHYFRSSSTEKADVDVRVNGGSWQNLARYQTRDASGNVSLDVSAIADAQPNVQFRWRYWDANFKLYWQLDNIRLSADPFSWPVRKNAKFAVVDSLVDDMFGYAADGNHVSRGYLAAGATDPRGVATTADGLKTWVLNYDKVVYVHDGDGDVLGSWTASQLKVPTGIATSGSDLWIVDKGTDTVYRFAGAVDATSGELTASSSFKLNAGNATPEGLATDGTTLWVVDGDKPDGVFVYDTSGVSLGSWSIDPANTSPTGIAIDPTGASQNIWIVDISTGRVYEYADARGHKAGSSWADESFALASANASPHDIAVQGVNAALQLNAIGSQSIAAESELSFSISATDEGLAAGTLTYAASDLPPGATFDPATHTFRWTPVLSQACGTYAVTFSVTDGVAFASEEVVISVFDPYPWQNHVNPPDADGSGRVSPLDALLIINRINLFGSGLLPSRQPEDPYFDVNRDGRVGPEDTLLVINCLNAEPEAEGESGLPAAGDDSRTPALVPSHVAAAMFLPTETVCDGWQAGETVVKERRQSEADLGDATNEPRRASDRTREELLTVLAASRSHMDWQAAADGLLAEPEWLFDLVGKSGVTARPLG